MLTSTARGVPRFSITRDRPSVSIRRRSLPNLERASRALTTMLSAMNSPFQLIKLYSSANWYVKNNVVGGSVGCTSERLRNSESGIGDTPESLILLVRCSKVAPIFQIFLCKKSSFFVLTLSDHQWAEGQKALPRIEARFLASVRGQSSCPPPAALFCIPILNFVGMRGVLHEKVKIVHKFRSFIDQRVAYCGSLLCAGFVLH